MGKLMVVNVAEIRENSVALRAVNKESENYIGLVDSIRSKGFLGAISVRQKTDETGVSFYELIDGLHRFNAAKDAGLSEINVDVVDLSEDQVLEAQIMANIHRVETRPIEYTEQLKRILTRNPMMTESELALRLAKSPAWIRDRLSLSKIENADIQALINEGKIPLANAYGLAKLPPTEQGDFVDRAMTQKPDEFIPAVNSRVKEIREANRKGGQASDEFQPVAHMRKLGDVKAVVENPATLAKLVSGVSSPAEAALLAVKWILHLDPESIAQAKAKDDARKAERAAAAEKRAAEKAAKAAEKPAKAEFKL